MGKASSLSPLISCEGEFFLWVRLHGVNPGNKSATFRLFSYAPRNAFLTDKREKSTRDHH